MRWLPVLLLFILSGFNSSAQDDTTAPYKKSPYIPQFKMQMPDSSWFSKPDIQSKKPTLILYFSPDCGHCQIETEALLGKIKDLQKLQVIMVTSRPFEDMVRFADQYKLARFPTVRVGTDMDRVITRFYDVKFTPFSALYDKKGRLVKVYEKGIDMAELIKYVK